MSYEKSGKAKSTNKPQNNPINTLTFKEAIEMGEYYPENLANYKEWHSFSKHTQLQYIRQAMDNRKKQLQTQWAEMNNVLNFRLKPEMKQALKNIEKQMKELESDREKLYLEYSS